MRHLDWKDYEKKLLANPDFVAVAKKLEPEYQLAKSLIAARIKKRLTQAQLAKRAKTDQASISRIEGAFARPSFTFLTKIADALEAKLTIRFDL
jgi:ribosome-binding protein aMBF1 (putative translation factor)